MRTAATVPPLLLLALVAAAPLSAQSVQGELIEEDTGTPIDGALVVLLDLSGKQQGGALTDPQGRFLLRAPGPGTYRLRAERIGHASTTSAPLSLQTGQRLRYRLTTQAQPITLEGLVASAERRCVLRPREGLRTHALWEEARKALSAAALTEAERLVQFRLRRYERELDAETYRVRREQSHGRSGYAERPFASLPARELIERGFVQTTPEGRMYYAPDAQVLLSDAFLDAHCFRVREGRDAEHGLIGLSFEPIRRRSVPGIRGVLWLDPKSGELRHLDYRYTDLDPALPADQLGGRVEFERLPTGAWIVRRWWLRMPMLGQRGRQQVLIGLREEGGEVTEVATATGIGRRGLPSAALEGTVYDSIRGAPLAGAQVFLSGTHHSAVTDEAGRFRMDGLPEGRYVASITHPLLEALAVGWPLAEVDLHAGGAIQVELATPSASSLVAAVCSGQAPEPDLAVLFGTVRDAASGTPLPGAEVVISWQGFYRGAGGLKVEEREATTSSDAQGRYRICGPWREASVTLQAGAPPRRGRPLRISLEGARLLEQDVALAPAKRVRVAGRLVDWNTGEPVAGAAVELRGTAQRVVSDGTGRFTFSDVAPGAYALEVRHLGYGEHTDSVHVSGDTEVTVRLAATAIPLDSVAVTVLSRAERERRARGTRVNVMTRQQIEPLLVRTSTFTQLLRAMNVPGLTVRDDIWYENQRGVCIQSGRIRTGGDRCHMVEVYVDDNRLLEPRFQLLNLNPSDIEQIEFLSPVDAGARYGTGAANGVLLIYTRATKWR